MGNNTEVYEQTCGICEEDSCVGCSYYKAASSKKETLEWLRNIFDITTDLSVFIKKTAAA